MVTAGIGALLVNRAAARVGIQIDTIVVGASRQRIDFVLEIEVGDDAGFFQPLGNLLRRFACFKFVDHAHPYQINNPHFNRHGTAGAVTAIAQPLAVFQPGFSAGQVRGVLDDDFFHANNGLRGIWPRIINDAAVFLRLSPCPN